MFVNTLSPQRLHIRRLIFAGITADQLMLYIVIQGRYSGYINRETWGMVQVCLKRVFELSVIHPKYWGTWKDGLFHILLLIPWPAHILLFKRSPDLSSKFAVIFYKGYISSVNQNTRNMPPRLHLHYFKENTWCPETDLCRVEINCIKLAFNSLWPEIISIWSWHLKRLPMFL